MSNSSLDLTVAHSISGLNRPHAVTRRRYCRQMNREHPLVLALLARKGQAHAWGKLDCWTLVLDTVTTLAGVDRKILSKGIPAYTTLTGAVRAAAATGGIASMLRSWGLAILPHTYPVLGDIAVCRLAGAPFEAAMIAMGTGRYLGVTEGGTVDWCQPSGTVTLFRLE